MVYNQKNNLSDILGSPIPFLDSIFKQLNELKIDVSEYELDHICYRVASIERYQALKKQLFNHGQPLTESLINGRPIATFRLNKPFVYQNRSIYLLELPAPKSNSKYEEGFEHIEFVIKEILTDFQQRHPTVTFDTKGISKKINPDLRVQLKGGSVKFHLHHLEYVIQVLDKID